MSVASDIECNVVHLLRTSGVAWCGAVITTHRVNGMPVMDNAVNFGTRASCENCRLALSADKKG